MRNVFGRSMRELRCSPSSTRSRLSSHPRHWRALPSTCVLCKSRTHALLIDIHPVTSSSDAWQILLANVYGWGVHDKCSLAMDPTGRMYRLSADEALGNVISEHLNYDQREPSGNLCMRTLELAAWAMPMFRPPPPRFSTARGKTYEDVAGSLNNRLALRYTELLECMDTHADAFLAVTAGLGVPPEVHRLAGLYPDCKHLASLPAELLWRNYFRERCLFLQRTAVAAVRSEAEREVKRRSSAKPSDVWQRILSYASRLLNSAGTLRSVPKQRPDMAEAMAELQASSINAFAVVHPLVDFSLGAASAVPWLGEARSGMDPNESPFDGMFESEPGLELLGLSSKLTQKDDIWAATSRVAPRITSAPDLLKLQEYTSANPDSYTTHAFQMSSSSSSIYALHTTEDSAHRLRTDLIVRVQGGIREPSIL